ncbi:MAG TPA: hypothetical protein VEV19_07645 [Ktedonobacteraceae bacterium]|nr:hypothetical protein [Ktedonobacteraceae bacterium]
MPTGRPDKSAVDTINRPLHWFDVFVGVGGASLARPGQARAGEEEANM